MSEFVFVLDASALARRFFDDIGKANLDRIFSYPNSSYYIPEVGIIETCSALLASQNAGLIDNSIYQAAKSAIYNLIETDSLTVISLNSDSTKEAITILEQYKLQQGKSFNGMDSIYILVSRQIAQTLAGTDAKVIFVTSDRKLYNAAKDESLFNAFHFWTCDLGCKCGEFIPFKHDQDRPAKVKECPSCGTTVDMEQPYFSNNTCSKCGQHCGKCNLDECSSSFSPTFS